MKRFLSVLLLALIAPGSHAASAVTYQCPMHPWIKATQPGNKCTLCGMVLVAASAGDPTVADDPTLITLTPASAAVVGVQTADVRRSTLVRSLRVIGVIEDDDTRHRILSARVPGRVEKLFVNYIGAEVRDGQPLATLYSPEMFTAQRLYIEQLRIGNAGPATAVAAARERLLDLGLTNEEVVILEHTREPTAMVTIRAPQSGTVTARHVYEGQQLNRDQSEIGTRLFEIADLSSMWFVFDAYEPDLAWLRTGQRVDVSTESLAGRVLSAPIAFIDPTLNEVTRTAKVRVVLPNDERELFHKQTALGQVRLERADVLLAPRSAVLQHGVKPVVFLQQGDRTYRARQVKLGRVGDTDVEILSGLNPGDRVVTEGALILDGQAQLANAAISGDSHDHSSSMVMAENSDAVSKPAVEGYAELKALALLAADAGVALAADDFAGYQKQLPALRAGLQRYLAADPKGTLKKVEALLRESPDLRTARRGYEPFSTALADAVRAANLHTREGLHVFECSMAPVLGIGRWVGRTTELQNPFFGSAMLECGDELK